MSAATTEIIARAVIRRDGQLLLARQLAEPWWFLPGGHVEPGERVELALVREIAEELGTEARIVGLVGVVENCYVDGDGAHHELNLVFEVALADTSRTARKTTWSFAGYRSSNSPASKYGRPRSRAHSWPAATTGLRSGTAGTAEVRCLTCSPPELTG